MFLFVGKRDDRFVYVRWDEGTVTVDDDPIDELYVRGELRVRDGQDIGPVGGPYTTRNHGTSALSTMLILYDVLDGPYSIVGDIPVREAIPFDAIG